MKYLMVVLDGMGDRGKPTPLEAARTPNFDRLSKAGKVGLLDIGYKTRVNSDFGYLNLLGCYDKDTYPGRGYLEALGVGLRPKPQDICIRGNFATLDPDGTLVDRRAGRDETSLDAFCEALNNTEIDGVRFEVKKSAGHRVVLVLKSKRTLSPEIKPNDPEKTGVPLPQVIAKEPKAKFTASVLNKFVRKTHEFLKKEPINRERKLPANVILIRNPGKPNSVPSFQERFGLKGCCVAGIPIAHGVSRYLGMTSIPVKGATGMPDTNLEGKVRAVQKALEDFDFVFLHINGTDILSHDAKRREKTAFIAKIDKALTPLLKDMEETIAIITCDHRTDSEPSFKEYRHLKDPVPVLIAGGGITPNGADIFGEHAAERGFRLKGNGLVPFVLKITKK